MKTFVAIAALLASLLLAGCEPAGNPPAEDSPGWDCRKHGNQRCTP